MIKDEFFDGVMLYTSNFGSTLSKEKAEVQFNFNFRHIDYGVFIRAIRKISKKLEGEKFPGMMILLAACKTEEIELQEARTPCDICHGRGMVELIDGDPTPYPVGDEVVVKTNKHTKLAACKCPNAQKYNKIMLCYDEVTEEKNE